MAYKTGLRLLAAFCFMTVVLSPVGVYLLLQARKAEQEAEG